MGLVKEVTGAHLYAFFEESAKKKRRGMFGSVKGVLTLWQHSGKPGHMLRRYFIRWACLRGLTRPANLEPRIIKWILHVSMHWYLHARCLALTFISSQDSGVAVPAQDEVHCS